ncbi:MAG TPA: hypothetical protein VEV62_18095 [Parafilimonas sp.]|jgi:hypothetical protein|nr:hypothetical protein [Parafilimonas sp.]
MNSVYEKNIYQLYNEKLITAGDLLAFKNELLLEFKKYSKKHQERILKNGSNHLKLESS